MAKLTVKELERLTAADVGKRLSDEQSLYGIVRKKGDGATVMFRWRYRHEGRLHDFSCGTWPTLSLKEIREARDAARRVLASGQDPNGFRKVDRIQKQADLAEALADAEQRIALVEAQQARMNVSDLFERWAQVELVRLKDGGSEVRRMFNKDVLPKIGTIAVEDVRKGHIAEVTDALLSRGVERMAKLIFSLVRQMFRFAVDRDFIEHDPTSAIRKAKIGGRTIERDRVLSEQELSALKAQLPSANLAKTTELAIWIALSTCCRIGELLQARWENVGFSTREWYIPAENSKNGRAHKVFLSEFSIRHFRALKMLTGTTEWCYPNRDASGHVCIKTATKQIVDRQREDDKPMSRRTPHTRALRLQGGKWTPHDLRRTGATMMVALGIIPEVAERCLNHTEENRIKRTYQRHSYEPEMQIAWDKLGRKLIEIVDLSPEDILSPHHPDIPQDVAADRSMRQVLAELQNRRS